MEKWNQVGDSFSFQGIEAISYNSKNAQIEERFNLGIFFGTFEERGLTSSLHLQNNSCSNAINIFFDEAKDGELRRKYDPILKRQVTECTEQDVILIENIPINNVQENLEIFLKRVPVDCWQPQATWFIDLGGAPISYFIGLLGYLRDMFPRPKLTLFNPTGDYGEEKHGYTFTSGFERNMWIPRLWGHPDPTLEWLYIFLLGFEGSRSMEVYNLCEPHSIKALIGSPGYLPIYEEIALKTNERLLRNTSLWIGDEQPDVIKTNAADPVQTWVVLQKLVKEYQNQFNICFVPLGTKGHALGACLCALASSTPAILYHLPRSYTISDTKRGEYIWKYEVTL